MWSKVARPRALALLLAAGVTAGFASRRADPPFVPVVEAAGKRFKGPLAGTWVNDLGSKMVVNPPDASGQFTGSYLTAVSTAQKPIQVSPLVGALHDPKGPEEEEDSPSTFGFVVNWSFSDSIAAFVGQHFVDAEGKETLETTWLLRQKVGSHGDDWEATRVGRNIFTRGTVPERAACPMGD